MYTPFISVIVPVYNQENYLARCIESIITQSYKNLEILLIDDGSTDASGDICDCYEAKDSRIRVIHQKNSGISSVRNVGLRQATGTWISFIDSDDYISPDHFKGLIDTLQINLSAKMVLSDFLEIDLNGVGLQTDVCTLSQSETSRSFLKKLWDNSHTYSVCVVAWNKLYHRSLFNGIQYSGHIYEDERMLNVLYKENYTILYFNQPTYFYCQHAGSLIRSVTSRQRLEFLNVLMERESLFLDIGMDNKAVKIYTAFMDIYGELLIAFKLSYKNFLTTFRNTYILFFNRAKNYLTLKQTLRYFLIGYCPLIYVAFIRIKQLLEESQ